MTTNFCVMPFFGAEYRDSGFDTPCCLMEPSDRTITEIQQDMLDNRRPKECSKCWRMEDSGLESDRQIKNQAYDFYTDRDIRYIKEDCSKGLYSQQIVKLYTSNLCNSTCATCNSSLSSAWAALNGTNINLRKIPESVLTQIDFKNLKMLSFVGGEPLYEKLNFEILEQLAEVGNTNCYISMVTNGSTKLNQRQLATLSKFKNLNFCLSIDGIGPVFEYVRYPLKWDDLLDNLKLYRDLGIQLSVSYTISNLNVLYFKETIAWFESQGLQYINNVVYFPAHFHPSVLPDSVKQAHPELANFFNQPTDDFLIKQCIKELKFQNSLKQIKIEDYIPEFYSAISQP